MKSRGFALVELIIYIAILAIISILVIDIILVMTKSLGTISVVRNINNSAEVALERMTREIRLAKDINVSASNFDAHPSRLALNTINPLTGDATTMEFFLDNDLLMLSKGGGAPKPLSSSRTKVTNLVFRQINTPASKSIKIEMEIQGERGNLLKSEKFYNTATLRQSY